MRGHESVPYVIRNLGKGASVPVLSLFARLRPHTAGEPPLGRGKAFTGPADSFPVGPDISQERWNERNDMPKRYSWPPGEGVSGTIAPSKPADALPAGPVMTADEKASWRVLWSDRLARGVNTVALVSVFHHSASPCEGTCPNRIHGDL